MSAPRQRAGKVGLAGLVPGAVVLASLVPVAAGQSQFPPLSLGLLVAVAGCGALSLGLVATEAARAERAQVGRYIETAALWAAGGLAIVGAAASVAASAESLDLENIVLAQQNTSLYVVSQPLAAWVYLVAVAIAGHEAALRVMFGAPSRSRTLVCGLALLVLSALGATLFLGGFAGPRLPGPAWLAAKTLTVALAVGLLRRLTTRVAPSARLAIAWAAASAGFVNLIVTIAQALP